MVLVFLSLARRKRDVGAAVMNGDRMWGWSCSETGRVMRLGSDLGYRSEYWRFTNAPLTITNLTWTTPC